MEVKSAISSSGSYYPQVHGGGGTPQQVQNTVVHQQRDQLVSLQAPGTGLRNSYARTSGSNKAFPPCNELLFSRWASFRMALLWFGAGTLLLALLLASLPLLAIIFSFGACLIGGYQEWWEFTCEVLSASLWPATCFLAAFVACILISMRMSTIALTLPQDPMADDPLLFLARRRR